MISFDDYSGYTPEALRELMTKHELTQPQVAALLSISPQTVKQWCITDLESKSHRDMKLTDWRKLNAILNEKVNETHIQ